MAKKVNDVIIVIDDKAVRVPHKVWRLFHACAGQMIEGDDHREYYKGIASKRDLDAVLELYRRAI